MFERWLEVLREVARAREEEARRLIEELCGRALVVALFGSRARGDYTPLSDWDLLAVVEGGDYKVEHRGVGQVVWLPLDKLDEVLEWSMVVLDAVADAKPICGDREKLEEVRKKVEEYVKRSGLVRTKHGWFPA
jgi:predicted nucleotidyltransferase